MPAISKHTLITVGNFYTASKYIHEITTTSYISITYEMACGLHTYKPSIPTI
jgi:hypothetical protein